MKRIAAVVVALTVAGVATHWAAADNQPETSRVEQMMAEMATCEICSSMMEHPELMQSVEWETHKIDQGMLMVATVPKEHLEAFRKMSKQWEQAIEEVKAASSRGEEVELCTFCGEMGKLMQAGAKHQEVATKHGAVTLVTSDKPEVVKQIHALAEKSIELEKEMAQMFQAAN